MPLQEEHMGRYQRADYACFTVFIGQLCDRRSAEEPGEGRLQDVGLSSVLGKGRLGLQAEKGPFLSLSCQGKRGCEQRAHPSQFLSGGRWCRRFSCPGSAARQHASAVPFVPSSRAYAVFPGMRLSGQHSDGFEEPWVSRLPVSG